jgi:hypothetical protein
MHPITKLDNFCTLKWDWVKYEYDNEYARFITVIDQIDWFPISF